MPQLVDYLHVSDLLGALVQTEPHASVKPLHGRLIYQKPDSSPRNFRRLLLGWRLIKAQLNTPGSIKPVFIIGKSADPDVSQRRRKVGSPAFRGREPVDQRRVHHLGVNTDVIISALWPFNALMGAHHSATCRLGAKGVREDSPGSVDHTLRYQHAPAEQSLYQR
jgi:hypothetical protein